MDTWNLNLTWTSSDEPGSVDPRYRSGHEEALAPESPVAPLCCRLLHLACAALDASRLAAQEHLGSCSKYCWYECYLLKDKPNALISTGLFKYIIYGIDIGVIQVGEAQVKRP